MAFTPVEIIALVLLIAAVVKMVVLLINNKSYGKFVEVLFKNKVVTQIIFLILAAVVFYYLIQELTIIQIFAVAAFVACLIALGLKEVYKPIISMYKKHIKNGTLWKSYWLYTLIWLALMVWVFLELFFPNVI